MNKIIKIIHFLLIVTVVFIGVRSSANAGINLDPKKNQSNIHVFDFKSAKLGDVLKIFTSLTGKNVTVTPEIVDLEVTLYLEKIKPMIALSTLCKNYNLWYVQESNVIRVMKVEEYARELILRRDEKTRVFNLRYAACNSVAEMISCVFGERIEYQAPKIVESYGHVGTDDLPKIGGGAKITGGSKSGSGKNKTEEFAEDLKIPENQLARLTKILSPGREVTVENLLLYQVGQASALLSIFPRNNAIILRSVDVRLLDDVEKLILELDTPTRQVLLEVKILEIVLGDGFDSFFDISITPGAEFDSVGNVIRDTSGISGIDLVSAGALAESTLKFSYIDKQLQTRLELLEKDNRVKKIGTPVMLCANNAAAKFFQGIDSPVRKGYSVTEEKRDNNNNVTSPATVTMDYEEEELGVTLEISPSINMDRTVTLKIISEISTLIKGGGPTFYYTISGIPQTGETDSVSKTKIEDIIVAMDGQCLALGGLIKEENVDVEKKVPVLGDVPLLGFFFKSKSTSKERTELVFTVKPHIIMAPDEAVTVNDGLLKSLSEHPYYKENKSKLLDYDRKTNSLEKSRQDKERTDIIPVVRGGEEVIE